MKEHLMIYFRRFITPFAMSICILVASWATAQTVIDFEEISLAPESVLSADASETPILTQQVTFNRRWNSMWDCCPSAWAVSNMTDNTSVGFMHSFSAIPGHGVSGSSNYAINNNFDEGEGTVVFPVPTTVTGTFLTNTTWTHSSILDGNDGNTPPRVRPFEDGDWFRVDIIGKTAAGDETGRIPFYLADYRNGKSAVVADWTWVDLTTLGNEVKSLEFALSSTDNDMMFGMNTPAYFAMDSLTISGVPEPTSIAIFASFVAMLSIGVRRHLLAE